MVLTIGSSAPRQRMLQRSRDSGSLCIGRDAVLFDCPCLSLLARAHSAISLSFLGAFTLIPWRSVSKPLCRCDNARIPQNPRIPLWCISTVNVLSRRPCHGVMLAAILSIGYTKLCIIYIYKTTLDFSLLLPARGHLQLCITMTSGHIKVAEAPNLSQDFSHGWWDWCFIVSPYAVMMETYNIFMLTFNKQCHLC